VPYIKSNLERRLSEAEKPAKGRAKVSKKRAS